jgi:hypothetical protein
MAITSRSSLRAATSGQGPRVHARARAPDSLSHGRHIPGERPHQVEPGEPALSWPVSRSSSGLRGWAPRGPSSPAPRWSRWRASPGCSPTFTAPFSRRGPLESRGGPGFAGWIAHHYIHHVDLSANINFMLPLCDFLLGTRKDAITRDRALTWPSTSRRVPSLRHSDGTSQGPARDEGSRRSPLHRIADGVFLYRGYFSNSAIRRRAGRAR